MHGLHIPLFLPFTYHMVGSPCPCPPYPITPPHTPPHTHMPLPPFWFGLGETQFPLPLFVVLFPFGIYLLPTVPPPSHPCPCVHFPTPSYHLTPLGQDWGCPQHFPFSHPSSLVPLPSHPLGSWLPNLLFSPIWLLPYLFGTASPTLWTSRLPSPQASPHLTGRTSLPLYPLTFPTYWFPSSYLHNMPLPVV